MESIVSKELDYKKLKYIHPSYRMTRIYAQSGSTTQNVTASGGQENIYEIPITPFNFSKSYFSFTATIPALADNYNFAYKDAFTWWRQIQIYTRGGIYLMDLNECANYTKVVWKSDVALTDFLTLDTELPSTTDVKSAGVAAMLQRSNASPSATDRPTGGVAEQKAGEVITSASSIAYTESKYLSVTSNVNNDMVIHVRLPLNLIKNTICALDKDIYVGEVLLFRIVWNPTSKIYYTAEANDGKIFATVASGAGPIAISNMELTIASEKNSQITNDLIAKVSTGGFQMLLPYVYTYKNGLAGTNVSTSLRFNRGHGKNLQKIYYAVFNGNEGKNTAYDNNNVTGTTGGGDTGAGVEGLCPIITTYYTLLNNTRLQEFNMVCADLDDYQLLYDKLKGSITQNSNIYQYNQFWVDEFCGIDKFWHDISNYDCGLDLSVEQKWDIYLTMTINNILNHYAFAVTQKVLTVSSTGVTVM